MSIQSYKPTPKKVLDAPEPKADAPLLAYEQRALRNLLNAYEGCTERVQQAFLETLRQARQ